MWTSELRARPRRRRTIQTLLTVVGLGAALLSAVGSAQPALDLFDEAAYFLALQYGGFAGSPPQALAPGIREDLAARCERRRDCPVDLGAAAIEDLIARLDDPHTAYLPPRTFADARRSFGTVETRGPGFGLQVAPLPERPGLVVLRAFGGGPADAAGLRRGDVLVACDGDPLPAGRSAIERLRLAEADGGAARLTIERASGPRFEVRVQPRTVAVEPALTLLDEGIGHLDIPSFFGSQAIGPSVHDRVRDALAAGVRALVIDVRANPGGLLPESLVAAGAFVDEARRTVHSPRDSSHWVFTDGRLRVETARGQVFPQYEVAEPVRFDGPVAVLVNDATASAAEFFAHDLKEAGALVVGGPTFGVADTGTSLIGLSNGGGLQITTGKILHPDGRPYRSHVEPDVHVEQDLERLARGEDVALRLAVEWLQAELRRRDAP